MTRSPLERESIPAPDAAPQAGIPLAGYTTWRVGGPAEWFAEPATLPELISLLAWAVDRGQAVHLMGAGSNLLIHDAGLEGLTLCLRRLQGARIDPATGLISALAGEPIPTLARRAARAGLAGLEWSVGIPGTVGGAAVMNAGAQGGCIAERLVEVEVIEPSRPETPHRLSAAELRFGYRHSRLQEEDLVVLSASFQLEPGHDPRQVTARTTGNLQHRTTTQPYHQPSCGSVFRNPEPQKAGRLIEGLGLKGRKVGGAMVSDVHANFIVNTGEATAEEIESLISQVQAEVLRAHGIGLVTEVKRLGW
ncbi:UDP-N-acetylmuramate dehydrogenase [Synechococcus sp. RSCCF101]|uniref:UDP-N-acetylmuramate dehydrogenase n=1 Tax=Synechococcus sp. RSCCF101 TaxID=2511069 RepID=UPI001243EB57|nr:UDP-N-acetylmuramate dehydrogenase [Synechococcus sp. RSCCF101]QEY32564.1 UDP-N-acetylmuramate dehydrogenase [Synechococcus sp. RSCCF101]